MNITKKKKVNFELIGIYSIALIVLTLSVFKSVKQKDLKQRLIQGNHITVGTIVEYSSSGRSENQFITYVYDVENIQYQKEENRPLELSFCYRSKACVGKKFRVYYDVNNPEISYLDLENEF